jgi:hypothetical protein
MRRPSLCEAIPAGKTEFDDNEQAMDRAAQVLQYTRRRNMEIVS